jgi:hypothetical protein
MEASEILEKVKKILELNIKVDWDFADVAPEEEFQAILDIIIELETKPKQVDGYPVGNVDFGINME